MWVGEGECALLLLLLAGGASGCGGDESGRAGLVWLLLGGGESFGSVARADDENEGPKDKRKGE